jgi:hypothetical protein
MRRGGGEIAATIAAGRQDHGFGAEAVDRAVFEAHRDHAPTGAIFHDQIDGEIFDEEVRRVFQALLIQRVEHRMAGAVGGGASALHRRAFAHVLHMAAERPLVNRTIGVAAEWDTGMFQLVNRLRRFAHHVFDRVLVAQPVRTLDGVEHMPSPVIGRIVA